jgi:hypothetical protein
MLVGICGKAGSGKDTIGDYLVTRYKFQRIALADPIKRLVKDIFVLDDHTVYDRVAREQQLKNWPDWTVRKLLQFIGTELFRNNVDDAIWVKSLWLRIVENPDINYVVTDVRFPNELKYFQDNAKPGEFMFIKVVREGCNGVVGLQSHASEAYDLDAEYVIDNNGTFENLYNKIDEIVKGKI